MIGASWRAGERPVIRAVTGAGKAQLISELCAQMADPSGVVVVAAPRQVLVEQLSGFEDPEPGSIRWRIGDRVGVYYGRRKVIDRDVVVTCTPSLPGLVEALAGRPCRALIVDECHRSETPEILAAVEKLAPRRRVGFSATPWRTEKAESLSLFSNEAYTYGLREAIREGVLVEWDDIGDERGGNDADSVVIDLVRLHGIGPGIISAKSIADAEAYAARLVEEGLPALAVHSAMPRTEIRSRIARLRAGELRCLVHVALLQEGVDLPWLRWLAMRRPNCTAIRYFQELGRVIRCDTGKTRATLIDPYNHAQTFGDTHDSAIGAIEAAIEDESKREPEKCVKCGTIFRPTTAQRAPYVCFTCRPPGEPAEIVMPPTVAKSAVVTWARRGLLTLIDAGVAEARSMASSAAWRSAWPSNYQLDHLRKIGGAEVSALLPHLDLLNRGEVGDLLAFFFALRTAQRRPGPPIEIPPIGAGVLRSLAAR